MPTKKVDLDGKQCTETWSYFDNTFAVRKPVNAAVASTTLETNLDSEEEEFIPTLIKKLR